MIRQQGEQLNAPVRIEGEGLAFDVHLLQLRFIRPAAVLYCEVDIGGVAARRVGEHPGGCLPGRSSKLLGLQVEANDGPMLEKVVVER